MGLLDRMKAIGAAAAAKVAEQAPGVAASALKLGAAAASATASAAAGAYENVRDFAADRLKNSRFSEVDVQQAAGALEYAKVGKCNPDGTFQPLTDDERLDIARMALVATLEDDGPAEDDEGED